MTTTNPRGTVLVTGSTGNVGSEVVQALLDQGQRVRALVRRQSAAPRHVETVVGDLNHPETLIPAFEGVRAVFLLAGYRAMPETVTLMRQAGVERVVLLSSSAAPSRDMTNAIARYHIESEDLIRESGLVWTFLQPNSFMSNTLRWLPQLQAGDVVRAPFPDVPIATIDPYDVAAVATAALIGDGHHCRSHRLSGPESLRPADQLAILAGVLGRELKFEAMTDNEARHEMNQNMPSEYVDAIFSFFADGTLDESQILPTVEDVTGRGPRRYRDWVANHVQAFQGPETRTEQKTNAMTKQQLRAG